MKRAGLAAIMVVVILAMGCDTLRFAPGQSRKQNAWLHNRTTQLTADLARGEETSRQLQELARLSEIQSRAFTADYGLPDEFPPADNVEQILSSPSFDLAESAVRASAQRPDVWDVTDGAIELGIAVAGLVGGMYGIRASQFLKRAKTKSKALREIVGGNEIFKREHSESAAAFKAAHNIQSPQTRKLVAELKIA